MTLDRRRKEAQLRDLENQRRPSLVEVYDVIQEGGGARAAAQGDARAAGQGQDGAHGLLRAAPHQEGA